MRTSGASQVLIKLAERLAIPVVTSLNGKDSIPGHHPLAIGVVGTYSRAAANWLVNEADLVCFIGTETGSMTTHFWQLPRPGVDAIQIDIDPEALGRNYPLQAAVLGDANTALTHMLDMADETTSALRVEWTKRATALLTMWQEEYRPLLESDGVPIRPERLCSELTKHVPDDAIVVVDTGHAGMWMGGMFDLRSRKQSYLRSAGHLGWAFPASLGAKCGQPNRPVVCFTGDSGLWYHIAEIETAVRSGINTVTVVNNNRSGNQSRRGFDRAYYGKQTEQAKELWISSDVDFARLADNIGAVGIRVEQPSAIRPALERAFELNRPVIVDVVTDIDALAPLAELARQI